jgi:hypothetical protein
MRIHLLVHLGPQPVVVGVLGVVAKDYASAGADVAGAGEPTVDVGVELGLAVEMLSAFDDITDLG